MILNDSVTILQRLSAPPRVPSRLAAVT